MDCECFASPLNSCLVKYCSPFQDTDQWFGSLGSFFDYHPEQGSFEVNPPFSILSTEVEDHLLVLLEKPNAGPLTFVLVFPTPRFIKYQGHAVYTKFKVENFQISKADHWYIAGSQHEQPDPRSVRASHDTTVAVLQNPQAARLTPVEKFQDLRRALPQAFRHAQLGSGSGGGRA